MKLHDCHIVVFTTEENPEVVKIFLAPEVVKGTNDSWTPNMADIQRNVEKVRPGQTIKTVELYKSKWVQIGIKK